MIGISFIFKLVTFNFAKFEISSSQIAIRYLSWCVLFLAMNSALADHAKSDEPNSKAKPNILWIISDDLSPDLGCYGETAVSTPHLDRLASTSTRYTNAFATCPTCSPSRSAFVTGVFQTTLGAHAHRTRNKKPLPEGTTTVMQLFRDAGYYVTNIRKEDYNFVSGFKFDSNDWTKRKPEQPFFAQIQIKEPHRKLHRNTDPDRPAKIKLPPQYPDHPLARADWANYLQSIEVLDKKVGKALKQLEDEGVADNTIVFFFGDHGRPHVWCKQWLYEGGIKVPLIVYRPGLNSANVDKKLVSLLDIAPTTLRLAGLEIPAFMQGKNFIGKNSSQREMIFAARDRAGDAIDRARCVRTKDFKYIRNYNPELPYSTRSSYKVLSYPVLTLMKTLNAKGELTPAQARFMAPTKPKEELYDLKNDPFELNNLAASSGHSGILGRLSSALDKWETETNDQGRFPEMSDEAMEKVMKEKLQWRYKTLKKRGLDKDVSDEAYLEWWMKELNLNK